LETSALPIELQPCGPAAHTAAEHPRASQEASGGVRTQPSGPWLACRLRTQPCGPWPLGYSNYLPRLTVRGVLSATRAELRHLEAVRVVLPVLRRRV